MTVCVLVPTPLEYSALCSVLPLDPQPGASPATAIWPKHDVLIVESGLGQERSRSTLAVILARFNPESVLLAGTAGALNDELRLGDVVVCQRIGSANGSITLTDQPLTARMLNRAQPTAGQRIIRPGSAVTVDRPVITHEERRRLREDGYDCVEMEAFAVACFAAAHSIPFSMVRAISDLPGEGTWADGVTQAMTAIGFLLTDLFHRPA